MELAEIRDLDGPNLFALEPVVKIEVIVQPGEQLGLARQQYIAEHTGHYVSADPIQALQTTVIALHKHLRLYEPSITTHEMDELNHLSICFPWSERAKARAVAQVAFDLVAGERIERLSTRLIQATEAEYDEDEPQEPTWVRDTERAIPTAAVTGTNGKTTTTRFLAHLLRSTGKRVGWSSSSGVYIEGEQVIDGDYTGHGGARRVLTDTTIDYAVLETARGGILLRGLGYESSDVSIFLNVSEDHLNLHGVNTIETLARVKATVIRTTTPTGVVVLNADDPLVLAQKSDVRANVILISQDPENPALLEHASVGGRCVTVANNEITLIEHHRHRHVIPLEQVPLTFRGMARHMVENALAACAGAVGMGLSLQQIAEGMKTFQPDREHNAGRLNVFDAGEATVVIDFAHNESGLQFLLDFARQYQPETSRLTAIIGTAGDRQDSVFVGLGRIAGRSADRVLLKSNPKFLRGRVAEGVIDLMRAGLHQSNAVDREGGAYGSEFEAVFGAIEDAEPGEIIVAMCVEDYRAIIEEFNKRGAVERTAADM
jgi:cyanophycin synthetase